MSAITETISLIYVEQGAEANHNKVWYGELFDNGDVRTRWGRIGLGEQSKMFPGAGQSFLKKKEAEKIKKGYTVLKTLPSGGTTQTVAVTGDLLDIARKQIVTNSPILDGLISRLVKANVHSITSSTQISYNSTTGLFTTPLGIVTLDGINEGRALLAECGQLVDKGDWTNTLEKKVSSFLRIVPQNIGMKRLDVRNFFPDVSAITKQNDILDSLEASYKALQTAPVTGSNVPATQEQVFKVKMSVLDDKKERDRIIKKYESSKKSMHSYNSVRITEIYALCLEDMDARFDSSLGNIKEVFHGSSMANVLSILKSGLRVRPPATAKIAGALFGAGIYGTETSTKALGYTFNRWGQGGVGDAGFMFICDFAMGKPYMATSYGCKRPAGYDSIHALPRTTGLSNDELIVPTEKQAKIKYMIELK